MPRAKRHYIPGYVWHITHRCHKKEFLLKFASDRRRWLQWVFEARKRYRLSVPNYTVTSNHVHLSRHGISWTQLAGMMVIRHNTKIDPIDCGENWTGIQSEKELERSLLGRSVSVYEREAWVQGERA